MVALLGYLVIMCLGCVFCVCVCSVYWYLVCVFWYLVCGVLVLFIGFARHDLMCLKHDIVELWPWPSNSPASCFWVLEWQACATMTSARNRAISPVWVTKVFSNHLCTGWMANHYRPNVRTALSSLLVLQQLPCIPISLASSFPTHTGKI